MSRQRRRALRAPAIGAGAVLAYLAAAAGCLATPDFSGTCYRCSQAHPECPSDQICVNDVCSDPGTRMPVAACSLHESAGSCAALTQGCGLAGGSCCETIEVPGGTFNRSHDDASDSKYASTDSNQAMVSSFHLDRYEVTVGRFRAFVTAGMGTTAMAPAAGTGAHPLLAGSGWQATWNGMLAATPASLTMDLTSCASSTWTAAPGANENRPINCVSWYEAMAFCIWDGGYLPTEAEWNYAAAGGSDQRPYPWSMDSASLTIDATRAVYSGASPLAVGSTSPLGDGKWGHADLGGNVWEWTLDAVPPGSKDDPTYPFPCSDCAILAPASSQRLQRGGGFDSAASDLRTGERAENDASTGTPNVGLRCARP